LRSVLCRRFSHTCTNCKSRPTSLKARGPTKHSCAAEASRQLAAAGRAQVGRDLCNSILDQRGCAATPTWGRFEARSNGERPAGPLLHEPEVTAKRSLAFTVRLLRIRRHDEPTVPKFFGQTDHRSRHPLPKFFHRNLSTASPSLVRPFTPNIRSPPSTAASAEWLGRIANSLRPSVLAWGTCATYHCLRKSKALVFAA
jgi:hypothetical protein